MLEKVPSLKQYLALNLKKLPKTYVRASLTSSTSQKCRRFAKSLFAWSRLTTRKLKDASVTSSLTCVQRAQKNAVILIRDSQLRSTGLMPCLQGSMTHTLLLEWWACAHHRIWICSQQNQHHQSRSKGHHPCDRIKRCTLPSRTKAPRKSPSSVPPKNSRLATVGRPWPRPLKLIVRTRSSSRTQPCASLILNSVQALATQKASSCPVVILSGKVITNDC